jgi:hypothetical protein
MGMKVVEASEYDYDYWNGRLLIWEEPKVGESYAIGVDPAEGVGADRSVCEVIKIGNLYHPDEQVAELACDFLDPIVFGAHVKAVGDFYASDGLEAFATVECNAPCGDTMVNDLRMRLDYTNLFVWKAYDKVTNVYTNKLGWWTNRTTRPKLIARGLHALVNNDLIIHSSWLIDEMSDFERDHFIAKAKARYGRHDDRVMALLIGYWGAHDDEWMSGEDVAEERRLRAAVDTQPRPAVQMDGVRISESIPPRQPGRKDWQNTACTYRTMVQEADGMLMED